MIRFSQKHYLLIGISLTMSLKKDLENIGGVRRVNELEGGVLQVIWFGHPSDYKSSLKEVRDEHNHEVIEAPDGRREETEDKMPIMYVSP